MKKYAKIHPENWNDQNYYIKMDVQGQAAEFDLTASAIPENETRVMVMINRDQNTSEHYVRKSDGHHKCYRFTRLGNFLDCTEVLDVPV